MSVKHYDPKKVSVIYGSQIITGFADGDFVTVERNEDAFSLLVGADGESTRSKNSNKSGKVTLRLLSSSASNDYLSEMQLADELSGNAPSGLMIKDTFGTSIATAATAWITKQPSSAYGKEAGTREWVIETDELIQFTGGNS
jgi:hypothetical protein